MPIKIKRLHKADFYDLLFVWDGKKMYIISIINICTWGLLLKCIED